MWLKRIIGNNGFAALAGGTTLVKVQNECIGFVFVFVNAWLHPFIFLFKKLTHMKRQGFIFLLLLLTVSVVNAQKGNNQLQVFGEAGIANDAQKPGFGAGIKGALGVGEAGQLTLTAGVMKFRSRKVMDVPQYTTRLIPVLAGYKHHSGKFYFEPQLGIGELGGKIEMNGDYARPSVAAFCWAIGIGIDHRRFDVGVRYLATRGIEGKDAGTWYDRKFHYTGLHLGYKLFR
jgi:hypothetical protein